MKTKSILLNLAALTLALTAQATTLEIQQPSTVSISGRLMSPSGGWNWTIARAGVITVKDGSGATVAEKVWNDFNAASPDTYAARDTSITNATVSKPLSFSFPLEPGSYDLNTVGSYSQAAAGYLWVNVATEVTPSAPTETWDWVFYSTTPTPWSTWTPDPATITTGQPFTQTRTRTYEERKKEVSSLGGERNDQWIRTVTETETQAATGTKPKATPVISWSAPVSIVYGTRLTSTQLNATATVDGVAVAGNFNYSPGEGTTLNAGENQCLEVTFTPTESDKFDVATATQTLTVNKASTTLTITSPTNPSTLPIDSAAAITTTLRRDHDNASLSTANVSYFLASSTGTAAATLSMNQVTMAGGNGDDTLTVRASFPGNANHLPSEAAVAFRVPRPGSLVFTASPPLVSPVTLPAAFLHAEHGATSSTLEVQVSNPGELPVEISGITVAAELGSVTSFALADENGRANTNTTLAAGQTRNFRITFRPSRYALNRDTMRISWRCRPNITTVGAGEVSWTLEGQGLAPRMATVPFGSAPDATNARDLNARWPALRSQ